MSEQPGIPELAPLLLVVDDNDAARFGKMQQTKRAGYRVVDAATGAEALRLARELQPDVILLDVNLPDMSGVDVCRQLKSDEGAPPVHVLQISSTAVSDADRTRGLLGGADVYLTEPIGAEVLLATIEALLRVRRAELSLRAAVERERKARNDAERANRFKDEFLATLSHELRTPLSATAGWIWQLRHGISDDAIRQRALDALERSTNTQVRMINDLLDVSRIGRGKLDLDLAPVDLGAVINEAVEAIHAGFKTKQLVLTVSTMPVAIMGDAARLQQIVGNLLGNAVKFSLPNGNIDVSLTTDSGAAVIRVKDTGVGIEAALLPHVFEQFRQGEGGFTRRHPGLGLGLAIVRQLVTLHGGTVIAESDGGGRGATFTVRLPLAGISEGEPSTTSEPVGHPLRGARLLVVDDDPDIRAWLKSVIEFGGGSVTTADSVDAALEAMAREPADMVVSDIGMPVRDGLMLIETLRGRGFRMPAVAVTAFSSADERRRILAAGYDAYFSKPIDPATFIVQLTKLRAAKSLGDEPAPKSRDGEAAPKSPASEPAPKSRDGEPPPAR